jgi:cytochrome c biogenesis protein CcdA
VKPSSTIEAESLMNHRATRLQETASFVAGVLIGTSIVTPVFAAASDIPAEWQPFLLIGSVVLLAMALMLKALGTRPSRRSDLDESADLREANRVEMIDVPLHQ